MLIVYKNRRHDVPFGGRRIVQGPPSLRHTSQKLTGSEELFYIDLGLNYEVFKYYKEALASYELAFRYPIIRPGVYNSLVLETIRCLLALDRVNEAAEFLQAAAAQAPTHASRNQFLSLRQQILSRMRGKTR